MSNAQQMAAFALINGKDASLKALGEQYPIARNELTKREAFDPYYNAGVYGSNMVVNALGGGGQAGRDYVTNAFQADPGYQFRMDQGLQALNRTAASRGMLASGNNSMDLMNYAQGLASDEYGKFFNRLSGLSQQGLQAAGGVQQKQGMLSGLDYGYGTDQAGVQQQTARSLADVSMRQEEINANKKNGPLSAILGGVNLLGGILGGGGKR